jgi:glycosyl hydrolase family 26
MVRRTVWLMAAVVLLGGAGTVAVLPGANADDCAVDEILVNECRPWLGARASDYPDAGAGEVAQLEHHEQRIGRQVDLAHSFAGVGQLPLATKDQQALATRADTYLFQNWKPTDRWAKAGGDDDAVNADIDAAADNIRAIAPKKIFLTVHHEAENDVTSDPDCAANGDATAGTAAEYVAMWHNVRARFDAKGVDNVVWVVDYMNYEKWDCLVPKLYPGDDHVDWVMFNGYGSGNQADFVANVDHFYQLLTDLSGPERDLLAKPWGIVEWGISGSTQQQAIDYYAQAAKALSDNRFPKLKAYQIFDSPGTHDDGGLRVGYDDAGKADPDEQAGYTEFANSPAFAG